jgi:hypothetical protein
MTHAFSGCIHFPALHPSLAVAAVPEAVRFLDPGLGATDDPRLWRPASLPLGTEELAGFLREFARLRQEVRDPKDLRLLAGASGGHFFTDTTFAIREELADQAQPERVAARRLRAAQLSLCLAWMVEESLLDLAGAGEAETRFRAAMAESLGLDETEDEAADLALAMSGAGLPGATGLAEEFCVPWSRLLSPFWAVLPESAGLFASDPALVATWLDAGLALAAPAPDAFPGLSDAPSLAGTVLAGRETGWRLLGKTRPDPEAPWLGTPRTIVILQP